MGTFRSEKTPVFYVRVAAWINVLEIKNYRPLQKVIIDSAGFICRGFNSFVMELIEIGVINR